MKNRSVWPTAIVLILLLGIRGYSQTNRSGKEQRTQATKIADLTKQVTADLKEARDLLRKVTDKTTRERLELLLSRSELKLGELQQEFGSVAVTGTPGAASAADFAPLLKRVESESFDSGRLSFLQKFGPSRHYSSAQVGQLLEAFTFDSDRAKAAIALYPQVIDPENYFQALESFDFDSNRKTVEKKLQLPK